MVCILMHPHCILCLLVCSHGWASFPQTIKISLTGCASPPHYFNLLPTSIYSTRFIRHEKFRKKRHTRQRGTLTCSGLSALNCRSQYVLQTTTSFFCFDFCCINNSQEQLHLHLFRVFFSSEVQKPACITETTTSFLFRFLLYQEDNKNKFNPWLFRGCPNSWISSSALHRKNVGLFLS